eukprot:CAMPEP_0185514452 /NCGR_PEP_ID=MMETSP1366-20130426/59302_1 /TAXON_ID=38817 /ORGANISM="Gephyrocapsa oceanica, Strain RCC1303" /LENGTH=141 /DNA_ID=CAMNT_0028125217 /DNA_START=228 /DNA_END=652 /DNA_ORIENTATION=+
MVDRVIGAEADKLRGGFCVDAVQAKRTDALIRILEGGVGRADAARTPNSWRLRGLASSSGRPKRGLASSGPPKWPVRVSDGGPPKQILGRDPVAACGQASERHERTRKSAETNHSARRSDGSLPLVLVPREIAQVGERVEW